MRDAALGKTRAFNGGFFTQRRLRRILELAGIPYPLDGPNQLIMWQSGAIHPQRTVACV